MTKETRSQIGLWKHKRPNVAEWINYCFDGVLREQALAFAEWVRLMGFKHKIHSTTNIGHNVFYNKEYMCNMQMYKDDNGNSHWSITPTLAKLAKYEDIIKNEGLADLPWMPNYCIHKIQPDKTKICNTCNNCSTKGIDRLVFGEAFIKCCVGFPTVINPDSAALNRIKRLLELEKTARDNAIYKA